jgi:hypothetical protein
LGPAKILLFRIHAYTLYIPGKNTVVRTVRTYQYMDPKSKKHSHAAKPDRRGSPPTGDVQDLRGGDPHDVEPRAAAENQEADGARNASTRRRGAWSAAENQEADGAQNASTRRRGAWSAAEVTRSISTGNR